MPVFPIVMLVGTILLMIVIYNDPGYRDMAGLGFLVKFLFVFFTSLILGLISLIMDLMKSDFSKGVMITDLVTIVIVVGIFLFYQKRKLYGR